MNRITLALGTLVLILAATVTFNRLRLTEEAIAPPAPTESGSHRSYLYGRVTTHEGRHFEGRLRFGGDEEAFWDNYFNGFKDGNHWAGYVPAALLTKELEPVEVLGITISRDNRPLNLGRPLMVRFGDIARIVSEGEGVAEALKAGLDYDPNVLVTLKSGTTFNLDRLEAGDFDDGVRVWDEKEGIVDVGPREIRSIDFLPTPLFKNVAERLHGTVRTKTGAEFTGFLQWDRKQALGSDELAGRSEGKRVVFRFDAVAAIQTPSLESALVTLRDGSQVELTGSRQVGRENRGVYVDDPRYGRVLVTREALSRVDFSHGGDSPVYDDYAAGEPLRGTVATRDGTKLTGRLVFDLDESEATETLDAPWEGVDYTIPFALVARIEEETVTLWSGESLTLLPEGDLGPENAGMLVFLEGRPAPVFVAWPAVQRIEFDVSVGGRFVSSGAPRP